MNINFKKNMILTFIVISSIATILLQLWKQQSDEADNKKDTDKIIGLQQDAIQESKNLQGKQDTLSRTQDKLNLKYEDIIAKQSEVIRTLKDVHNYVIGDNNKPLISLYATPLQRLKDSNERDFGYYGTKYRGVSFQITNNGKYPLHDVEITISGMLGTNITSEGAIDEKNEIYTLTEKYTSIHNGQVLQFHHGKYEAKYSHFAHTINVIWDNGQYTMFIEYEYPLPFAPLQNKIVKYIVGKKTYNNETDFINSKEY